MLGQKDFFFVNTHTPDKGAKIVVYCRSGRMSAIAAETLTRLGYTNVWDLDGGMIAWEEVGFPLVGK